MVIWWFGNIIHCKADHMITMIILKMTIWIINDNNDMISHGYVWDVANIVAYISLYIVGGNSSYKSVSHPIHYSIMSLVRTIF